MIGATKGLQPRQEGPTNRPPMPLPAPAETLSPLDVGLPAEEFDPLTSRMLGNFPQAYSHVGLINCALNLSRQTGPAEERAEW